MHNSTLNYFGIIILILAATLGLANSWGAGAAGLFRTGAPSTGGGTEGTCSSCHNGGAFGTPELAVTFANAAGEVQEEFTQYIPGETYTVTVAVGYTENEPSGYGFQSQFLTNATTPEGAGTAANPAEGIQITPNGTRQYIEQSQINDDSLFTFEWTAPAAGSGGVNYYVVGNLVNRNGGTSGDNSSEAPLIINLTEGTATSTRDLTNVESTLYPNPTLADVGATLELDVSAPGRYELRVVDMRGGTVSRNVRELAAGNQLIDVPTFGLPTGVYSVELSGVGRRAVRRLVVR